MLATIAIERSFPIYVAVLIFISFKLRILGKEIEFIYLNRQIAMHLFHLSCFCSYLSNGSTFIVTGKCKAWVLLRVLSSKPLV